MGLPRGHDEAARSRRRGGGPECRHRDRRRPVAKTVTGPRGAGVVHSWVFGTAGALFTARHGVGSSEGLRYVLDQLAIELSRAANAKRPIRGVLLSIRGNYFFSAGASSVSFSGGSTSRCSLAASFSRMRAALPVRPRR